MSVVRSLLAAILVAVFACSGRHDASSPEGAVQYLIAAARTGDRAAVYQRLGPATRARIEQLVASTQRTSGRLVMKPEDFLSVGWAPPAWEPSGMRTLRRDKMRAEVEVYSAAGDRQAIALVHEGKEWKIELPGR